MLVSEYKKRRDVTGHTDILPRPSRPEHGKNKCGKIDEGGSRGDGERLHRVNGAEIDRGKNRGRHAAGGGNTGVQQVTKRGE